MMFHKRQMMMFGGACLLLSISNYVFFIYNRTATCRTCLTTKNFTPPITVAPIMDNFRDLFDSRTIPEAFVPLKSHPNIPNILITNDMCKNNQVDMLIYFNSACGNFQRRQNLRETWANKNVFSDISIRVMFLLGVPLNAENIVRIHNENMVYRDIVQADFVDSFENLTYKAMVALKWINSYCQHARYVLKSDDDIFVNIFKVVENILPLIHKKNNTVFCHYKMEGSTEINRHPATKWYVPVDILPNKNHFPEFCSGYAVVMTTDVIPYLYKSSFEAPFVPIDDVYMFGILPKVNRSFTFMYIDASRNYTLKNSGAIEQYKGLNPITYIVSSASNEEQRVLWTSTLSRLSDWATKHARIAPKPSKIKLGTITEYNTVYIVMIVVCASTVLIYTIFCILDLYACCDVPIFKNDTDEIADADLNSSLETDITRPILAVTLYPLTLSSPYVINNPAICTNVTDLKYIVIVHTATDNFQRRRLMRNTWANKNLFKSVNSRIVFFLGLTKNRNTQMWIENESVVYRDIVQGNFLDTYRNLTHKGVLSFRWISEHCRQAEMIVKIDDDIFVNPFILLRNFQPKMANMQRHIMCHYRKVGTSRIFRTRSKWTVDKDKFKGYRNYPFPYCDGFLVLMSPDMILALYRAASFTPFFWVDDVYLFGILPAMIGNVTYQNINSLTWRGNRGVKCYIKRKTCDYLAVNILKDTDAEDVWFAGLKMTSPLERKDINMDYVVTNSNISSDSTYSSKFRGSKL